MVNILKIVGTFFLALALMPAQALAGSVTKSVVPWQAAVASCAYSADCEVGSMDVDADIWKAWSSGLITDPEVVVPADADIEHLLGCDPVLPLEMWPRCYAQHNIWGEDGSIGEYVVLWSTSDRGADGSMCQDDTAIFAMDFRYSYPTAVLVEVAGDVTGVRWWEIEVIGDSTTTLTFVTIGPFEIPVSIIDGAVSYVEIKASSVGGAPTPSCLMAHAIYK